MSTEMRLSRVEAARLARNPILLLPFAPIALWVSQAESAGSEPILPYMVLVGYALVLPAFVMMAITVLSVLRSRYEGTEALLETMPVTRAERTIGHGLSTIAAGAVAAIATAAIFLYLRPGAVIGLTTDTLPRRVEIPRPIVAQYLQGPISVVLFCCFGVALARWLPSWLVILALVIPTAAQFLFFGIWSGVPSSARSWLVPIATGMVNDEWVGCGANEPCFLPLSGFDRVTPWWHLGYLAALAVGFVTVAVLRDRRDRVAWSAFGAALAAVVAFGLIQAAVYERYAPA